MYLVFFRLRSLNASCDTLPVSLVMIYSLEICDSNNIENSINGVGNGPLSLNDHLRTNAKDDPNDKMSSSDVVIGHSKISSLCSIQNACFIESGVYIVYLFK